MRVIQTVLTAALIVVLSVIAYDLHRIANDAQLGADIRRAAIAAANRPPETPEQRKERIRREVQRDNGSIDDTLTFIQENNKYDPKTRTFKR